MSHSFLRYLARRIALGLLFVLVVSSSALILVRLAPGDATTDLFLSGAGQASVAAARDRLGLDRPLVSELRDWLAGLVTLDLGQSSRFGRAVSDLVLAAMGQTARLAGLALLLAASIGLPLGMYTGSRQAFLPARLLSIVSVGLVSCPPIIGTLGLLFVGAATGWLSVAPGHIWLPTLALALPLAAMLERLQSQAAAEALASPDIMAAAARGVPRRRLVWLHAGRQALRPVLGVAGIIVATLFSGSVAVETLTAWPGLGRLTLDALASRDIHLAAGCALTGALLVAAGNLMADLLRAVADPRVGDAG